MGEIQIQIIRVKNPSNLDKIQDFDSTMYWCSYMGWEGAMKVMKNGAIAGADPDLSIGGSFWLTMPTFLKPHPLLHCSCGRRGALKRMEEPPLDPPLYCVWVGLSL